MDMSAFDETYKNDETGRAAYDPKILLKVVLFAYSRGIVSSRKIERACQENVIFMALACGRKPDHSTIAACVSSMKDEILPLFRDILLVCEEFPSGIVFFGRWGAGLFPQDVDAHGGFARAECASAVFRHGDTGPLDLPFVGFASQLGDQLVDHGQARGADGMSP
jgi:hypothetical protein